MDVCILGRIGYDLYAVEHNRPLAEVRHFERQLGGSSANMAVGLARLGLKVGLISCIGKDLLADYLIGFLQQEGVDTKLVCLVEGFDTSLCLTEVSPPESFAQVFYRSKPADTQVRVGEAEREYIRRARMLVTNGTSLAASPSREATLDALRTAHGAGIRTVFDMDYRASSWSAPQDAGRFARTALQWVDVVLGNETELSMLTANDDAQQQVRNLFDSGVKLVVRKLGPKGVEAHTSVQSFSMRPFPLPVVCAVGGGDGFAAGFLYGLFRGLPIQESLRYGNAAAAVVVSQVTCSEAMPRLPELEKVIHSHSDLTATVERDEKLTGSAQPEPTRRI